MGKNLPIDLAETLNNFLGSYEDDHRDVLIFEAISNAIDAKANTVHITLQKRDDRRGFYIEFYDNGPGMTSQQFKKYYTVSFSQKQKGEGIGFAGVGAKIFLIAKDDSEIITVTRGPDGIFASRMYGTGNDIGYDDSPKSREEILGSSGILKRDTFKNKGTWYQVGLTENEYYYFRNNLTRILQLWFNYAILHNSPKIYINGEKIKPLILGKKEKHLLHYKRHNIACYFYYDCNENELADENRHRVYNVFGKRIRNDRVNFEEEIVDHQRRKVFCIVDVSILAC